MDDYSYQYASPGQDPYCYDNSTVLKNKFGIKNAEELAEVEREITGLRIINLERNPILGDYDLSHMKKIHKEIFSPLYSWAGELRQGDFLAKGSSIFCRGAYIEAYAAETHKKLATDGFLKGMEQETFIKKLAFYMGEINALHPFREGNGRTQREYFRLLAADAGYTLDYSQIEPEELLEADILAFRADFSKLEEIIDLAIVTGEQEQEGNRSPDLKKDRGMDWD